MGGKISNIVRIAITQKFCICDIVQTIGELPQVIVDTTTNGILARQTILFQILDLDRQWYLRIGNRLLIGADVDGRVCRSGPEGKVVRVEIMKIDVRHDTSLILVVA